MYFFGHLEGCILSDDLHFIGHKYAANHHYQGNSNSDYALTINRKAEPESLAD
jgi:hypothetical protein